jgi:hypothetical protein
MCFVYLLVSNATEKLKDPFLSVLGKKPRFMIDVGKLPIDCPGGLVDILQTLTDTRDRQGRRHTKISILGIATCALLSGADTYTDIWRFANGLSKRQSERFECFHHGLPSVSTFKRVLGGMDRDRFDHTINEWLIRIGVREAGPIPLLRALGQG